MLKRIPFEYKGRYAEVKWGDEDLVKHVLRNLVLKEANPVIRCGNEIAFNSYEDISMEDYYLQKLEIVLKKNTNR